MEYTTIQDFIAAYTTGVDEYEEAILEEHNEDATALAEIYRGALIELITLVGGPEVVEDIIRQQNRR